MATAKRVQVKALRATQDTADRLERIEAMLALIGAKLGVEVPKAEPTEADEPEDDEAPEDYATERKKAATLRPFDESQAPHPGNFPPTRAEQRKVPGARK